MSDFHCESCALHKTRGRNYVKGRGDVESKLFIIGGFPSRHDAHYGAHYMTDPSKHFERALSEAGLSRESVFCSFLVRCHDGDGGTLPEHVAACQPHLDREVSFVKPRVLLLLGKAACEAVLGKEYSAATRAKIWDSSECARVFTFSAGETIGFDDATGQEIRSNLKGSFHVVVAPDPWEALADPPAMRAMLRGFGVAAKIASGAPAPANRDYRYAHNEGEAFALLSEVAARCETERRLSFDIETSGFAWMPRPHDPYQAECLSIAFCFRQAEVYSTTLRKKHRSPRVVDMLRKVLESPIAKCGHNGNFDNIFLRAEFDIRVASYGFDTFVAASVLDQAAKMQDKSLDLLGAPLRPDLGRWWEPVEKFLDKKKTGYLNCPDDLLLEYNACDADATMALWEDMAARLDKAGRRRLFDEIVMPHYNELAEMQFHGVRLDVDGAKELGRSMLAKVRESEERCLAKVGRHPHWWTARDLESRGIASEAFRPFNLSSPQQLSKLVYDELKAPVLVKTGGGLPSTALEALDPLRKQFPFIEDLLAYRKDLKFVSSFVGWQENERPAGADLPDLFGGPQWEPEGVAYDKTGMLSCVGADGRLHADFHIDGTETGRITITKPALQTIPKTKALRNLLIPKDGFVFVDADFKALELRIIALLSGDPEFIRIFREGLDPHSITASKMFGIPIEIPDGASKADRDAYFAEWNKKHGDKRKYAKAVNFGIPYGEGAEGLADQLGVPVAEAQKWLDDWAGKTFPVAARWLNRCVAESRKAGGSTYSMGRFRPLPGFFSSKMSDQNGAERQAKNTPIQGTGGDCTSLSIVRIHERFRRELGARWFETARIVLEVHDQIVSEVRKDRAEDVKAWMAEEMSRQMPFLPDTLPLEVDAEIKDRWGD